MSSIRLLYMMYFLLKGVRFLSVQQLCIIIAYVCMPICSLVGAKYYSIRLIMIDLVSCVGKYYTYYD